MDLLFQLETEIEEQFFIVNAHAHLNELRDDHWNAKPP